MEKLTFKKYIRDGCPVKKCITFEEMDDILYFLKNQKNQKPTHVEFWIDYDSDSDSAEIDITACWFELETDEQFADRMKRIEEANEKYKAKMAKQNKEIDSSVEEYGLYLKLKSKFE